MPPKQAKNDKQIFEQRLTKAQSDKERLNLTYKYKKAHIEKNTTTKHTITTLHKAPAAKQEAVNFAVERYSNQFNSEESKVYYGLHLSNGNSFFFDINLPSGKHDVEWGKTYTLADMNEDMSEWDEYDEDDDLTMHSYKTVAFAKTKGTGYDVHIAVTVTDEDNKEFVLKYDEDPITLTGTTVNVNITKAMTSCDYIYSDQTWLLRGNNNTYYVDLRFYSSNNESPAGTFKTDDVDLSSTYIEIVTDEVDEYDDPITVDVYAKDAEITVTTNGSRIDVSATIIGDDGNEYVLTLFFAYPEAKSQAEFTSNNLNIDDWALDLWGEVELFASDANGNSIGFDLFPDDPDDGFLGSYEISDNTSNNGYVTIGGEQFNIFSGTITISQKNDKYVVEGKVLAWNNVEYTISLTTPDPVLTPASFESDAMVLDIYPSDGFFEIAGFTADRSNYLLLTINSNNVAGDFSTDDIDAEYTYLLTNGSDKYDLSSADIHIAYTDGKATVTGKLIMINAYDQYDHLELTLNIVAGPYVPSERNVTIGQMDFEYNDDPAISYTLISEDYNQIFYFNIAGKFFSPDIELDKTYTLADMLVDWTYGENYYEREYVFYESVSFTKTKDNEGNVTITATVLDTRGNTWHLSYIGDDKTPNPIYVTLGQANTLFWGDEGVEYEMIDKDNRLACHLVFPMPIVSEDDDVVLDSVYTSADGGIDLEYSYLSIMKEEHNITEAQFVKSVYGDEVFVSAYIVDDRGYSYQLSYYDDGFHPTGETVNIKFDAVVEVTNYGTEWLLHAESDEVIVHFDIYGDNEDSPEGTYTGYAIDVDFSHIEFLIDAEENNWSYLMLHDAEYVTVTKVDDSYVIEADVTAEDGVEYIIAINKNNTAIKNVTVESKSCKRIDNGMLVIEKDGVLYNAQGARLN